MLTLFLGWLARQAKARRDRARLIALLGKDDAILDDIGLVRGDIETALNLLPEDSWEAAQRLSRRSLKLDCRSAGC